MSLYEKIQSDLRDAMKARDHLKAEVLKMLVSSVKYYLASSEEARNNALTDDTVIGIVKKQVKQREESKEAYLEAGREDLADKEDDEAQILQAYLPAMLSEEETTEILESVIREVEARGPGDLGVVMKTFMARTQGRADGKTASRIASRLLQQR